MVIIRRQLTIYGRAYALLYGASIMEEGVLATSELIMHEHGVCEGEGAQR